MAESPLPADHARPLPASLAAGLRVSVVMPAYEAAETIERSMQSVLLQTHQDVELIVVDDCSHDGTWALIEQAAASDPRVMALRQASNGGVAAARNAGIAAATGRYLAFLDSDDWWRQDKLQVQLAHMQQAGAQVSYSVYQRVTGDGQLISTVRPPLSVRYGDMLKSNCIGNLTGLYDRCLGDGRFEKVGHEDYVFWLAMVRRAGRAVCAGYPEPLAFYLVRPGSLSANKLRAARWQWHIYRRVEQLGWLRSGWYFMHYVARALAKRL